MVTAEDKDMERSRVLVIGGTGHIGKHIVAASLCLGHPTAILFKEFAPSNQVKVQLLNGWLNSGACLLKAIKCADFVNLAVGLCQVA